MFIANKFTLITCMSRKLAIDNHPPVCFKLTIGTFTYIHDPLSQGLITDPKVKETIPVDLYKRLFKMESLVDVITTVFQAILAVNVVFTVGYAYNGKRVSALSKASFHRCNGQCHKN